MFMIIVAIAAFIIFNIVTIKDWGWDWGNFAFSFLVGVGGFLGGMFICFMASGIFMETPIEDCVIKDKSNIELIALKDGVQMEGSAFLFSTVIDQELRYTYIYETEMGRTVGSVDADECYIKYLSKDETPYIKQWAVCPKSEIINWLFLCEYYRYTIYLPEGSVIENVYEIDLK